MVVHTPSFLRGRTLNPIILDLHPRRKGLSGGRPANPPDWPPQGHENAASFVQAFGGSQRYVLDYLTEEVLNRQPPEIQGFLLQTAILDRLSGSLCDAVRYGTAETPSRSSRVAVTQGAESQQVLETLEASNLFLVPLDEQRCWYRYHHLFADILRQRLEREMGDLVPELHRRASKWYERQGLISEAVGHSLAPGDFERAAHLIQETGWALFTRGEMTTILGWITLLPEHVVEANPNWACCTPGPWPSQATWMGRSAAYGSLMQLASAVR